MAETFTTLKVEVADFLSWGRNTEGAGSDWATETVTRLGKIVNAGYRQFLHPPILPGEAKSHEWSFLRPTATFDTVASTYLYDMAAGFGSMVGDVYYDDDENESRVIKQVSPALIDRERARDDAEGRPIYFALRPKGVLLTAAQTTECMLYPTPDAAYGLIYHYDVRITDISATNLYPLGALDHSETLLQSCRDIAVQRYKEDAPDSDKEREHVRFLEMLHAAVDIDRRNSPKFLGYNNDHGGYSVSRHGTEFSVSLSHNLGGGP